MAAYTRPPGSRLSLLPVHSTYISQHSAYDLQEPPSPMMQELLAQPPPPMSADDTAKRRGRLVALAVLLPLGLFGSSLALLCLAKASHRADPYYRAHGEWDALQLCKGRSADCQAIVGGDNNGHKDVVLYPTRFEPWLWRSNGDLGGAVGGAAGVGRYVAPDLEAIAVRQAAMNSTSNLRFVFISKGMSGQLHVTFDLAGLERELRQTHPRVSLVHEETPAAIARWNRAMDAGEEAVAFLRMT